MKKLLIIVIIFALIGAFIGSQVLPSQSSPPRTPTSEVAQTSPTQIAQPDVPEKLEIPKLSLSVKVEEVGKDSQGRMDIPKSYNNTGWYNLGPRPGEIGNAVIDGHVDTPSGAPSVFYKLDTLDQGDEIRVTDKRGQIYRFKVTAIESYPTDDFPIQKVFGRYESSRLNLITCSGAWDKEKRSYTERTVVYSEKI